MSPYRRYRKENLQPVAQRRSQLHPRWWLFINSMAILCAILDRTEEQAQNKGYLERPRLLIGQSQLPEHPHE
jgi:hypothetical protein